MKPTEDEVKQAVEALKKWQEDVAKTHSDGPGCYILLRIALETQVDRLVDILLAEKPALGQNIKKECDELLKEAELVDDLYAADARFKEAELLGSVRRLISRLQQIVHSSKEELSPEKPAETGGNATLKSKIKDFLWTLYEKTLKVIVDAVMERMWPKK